MSSLRIESLAAPIDSLNLGQLHKDILQQKLDEFTKLLDLRKLELDDEFRTFAEENGLGRSSRRGPLPGPPGVGQQMRNHQQEEINVLRDTFQIRLDQLFQKFQTQWLQDPRDKPVRFPLPKSGIESQYLSKQLGEALGRGLAEVCEQRPGDPIEYLGMWLRQYADNCKREQEEAVVRLKLRLEQEEDEELRTKKEKMARERVIIREEEERRRKIFLEQAKQIEKAKETPPPPEIKEGEEAETQGEGEGDKEGTTGGSAKRVTVVEPENPNTLYTIEEKDSVSGIGDDDEEEEEEKQEVEEEQEREQDEKGEEEE